MAYRRYSRPSRTRGRMRGRVTRRRTRRTSRRRSSAQRIVIQVIGGGAGGQVPISAVVAKKGVMPVRRRF